MAGKCGQNLTRKLNCIFNISFYLIERNSYRLLILFVKQGIKK